MASDERSHLRRRPRPCSCRLHGRNGIAAVYAIVMLTMLCGFASLAVDWGRVQLVKTELQHAADAASRAGAAQLQDGVSSVQSAAVTYGGYNTAAGTAV